MAEGPSSEISDDDEGEYDEEVFEFIQGSDRRDQGDSNEAAEQSASGNPAQEEIDTKCDFFALLEDPEFNLSGHNVYKQGASSGISEDDDEDEFDDEVLEFIQGSDEENQEDYDESFLNVSSSSSDEEDDDERASYPRASKEFTEEEMNAKCDFYHLLEDPMEIMRVQHLYKILESGAELGKILSKITQQLLYKFQQTMSRLAQVRGEPGKYVRKKNDAEHLGGFYLQFCMPYFKDSQFFAAPPTMDYRTKKANNELVTLDIVDVPWRANELIVMEKCIKECLVEEYATEYSRKRLYLEKDRVPAEDYAKIVKVRSLQELLKESPSEREFDWLKVSKVVRRHSETECQRLWHLFAKPHINKEPFTKEENYMMVELANKYDKQGWDRIAAELGTGRSSYQCFSQFISVLRGGYNSGKWTPDEDRRLLKIVESSKYGNYVSWPKVCYYMEDRAFVQVYAHWCNSLRPTLKKGKFSEEEDRLIGRALNMTEISDTKSIALLLGNRNPSQVRERLKSQVVIRQECKMGNWTLKEDKKLLDLVKELGEAKWAEIASQFKTRSRTQVRQRYSRIKRKMLDNPNFELTLMKRWKRVVPRNFITPEPESRKVKRKRKRKSAGPPAEERLSEAEGEMVQSMEHLIQSIRPPTSHEEILRQMEMVFALVCPEASLSDKAEVILSDDSYSEFHEPVRLLKGRRRSGRSKSHNRLVVEVSLGSKRYHKEALKPLFTGEHFQEYLRKLIQLPSQLMRESQ